MNDSNSPNGLTPTNTVFDDVLSVEVRDGNSVARGVQDRVTSDDEIVRNSLVADNDALFAAIQTRNNFDQWVRTIGRLDGSPADIPRAGGYIDNIGVDTHSNYYDQRINMLEGELIAAKAELIATKKELIEINNTLQEMQKTLKLLMEI